MKRWRWCARSRSTTRKLIRLFRSGAVFVVSFTLAMLASMRGRPRFRANEGLNHSMSTNVRNRRYKTRTDGDNTGVFAKQNRPLDAKTGEYKAYDPKVKVGDRIEVLLGDGKKHPEICGRFGVVSMIKTTPPTAIFIEVEQGGGTYNSVDLWWKRISS